MLSIKNKTEHHLLDYEKVKASFSCEQIVGELDGLPDGKGLNIVHEAITRHSQSHLKDIVMAVIAAANTAVDKVRSEGKPYLLVCNTYRFRAHSMFDAELYRDKREVEEWKKRDPIPEFEQYLLQRQWITETEITAFENKIENKIKLAVDFAEAGTWEPLNQLTKFVYSEKNN